MKDGRHSSLIFLILLFTEPNIEVSGWLYQTKTHFTHIVYQPFSGVSPPSFRLYGLMSILVWPSQQFTFMFGLDFFKSGKAFCSIQSTVWKLTLLDTIFSEKIKLIAIGKNSRRWRRAVIFPSCRSNFCRMVHNWISCSICCRTAKGK